MSSSVPMEHLSEKYDRKSSYSDIRRRPDISSKGTLETAEIPSQSKCSRMKQKRPDMPLYVPRARRLQEESEAQGFNRHTSPGRQKGKRSYAPPLEAQSKKLPKSTVMKEDPSRNSNSGNVDLTTVVGKTPEKNSSHVVIDKLLPQSKIIVIQKDVNNRLGDLKSTGAVSDAVVLGRDCFPSDDSGIKESMGSVPDLGEISNNSVVQSNTERTVEVKHENSDFFYLETSASGGGMFSDSVPVVSNTEIASSNSAEANSQDVRELSAESSVPFVSDDANRESLPSVQNSTNQPDGSSDQTEVFACPEDRILSELVSRNASEETGAIVDQNNLNNSSEERASQCSLLTSINDPEDSVGFECGIEDTLLVMSPPQVEIIISEKNSVIENLSGDTDCVQIMTSAKITRSKHGCDSEDENGKPGLNTQSDMDTSVEDEVHNLSLTYCHNETRKTESSNACVRDKDLPEAPDVETSNESCISGLPVQSETATLSKTDSGDLKSPKAMEVCDEKVSIGSKVFSNNGDSALEVESWDSMFDDDGECLNPGVLRELAAAVGSVQIKTSKKDYTEYKPLETTVDEEFGNIIEIHGFPIEFQTQDLVSAFSCFKTHDFTIKWVDDCHALGIFSGAFAASEALTLQHPYVKVRPLSQGIRESKLKAKRYAEHLLPCKPRPATSATLARRLVTGALGLKSNVSREQRETERLAIKQARDRKRQVAKQRQDIWNGIVS